MDKISSPTLADEGTKGPPSPSDFSFIRAAAGFVLKDGPVGGVFTGPEAVVEPVSVLVESPPPAMATEWEAEVIRSPSPLVTTKAPPAPLAHRLMVFALLPFVLIAVGGLVMINGESPRRPQPAPPIHAAPAPADAAPTPTPSSSPPSALPVTKATAPAPVSTMAVPTTRAPRVAPTSPSSAGTGPPAATVTTEPPTTTTEPSSSTTTQPSTTTTTQPPTTTTTQPTPTTTEAPPPQLTQQP